MAPCRVGQEGRGPLRSFRSVRRLLRGGGGGTSATADRFCVCLRGGERKSPRAGAAATAVPSAPPAGLLGGPWDRLSHGLDIYRHLEAEGAGLQRGDGSPRESADVLVPEEDGLLLLGAVGVAVVVFVGDAEDGVVEEFADGELLDAEAGEAGGDGAAEVAGDEVDAGFAAEANHELLDLADRLGPGEAEAGEDPLAAAGEGAEAVENLEGEGTQGDGVGFTVLGVLGGEAPEGAVEILPAEVCSISAVRWPRRRRSWRMPGS